MAADLTQQGSRRPPALVELHCHIEGAMTPAFIGRQLVKYGASPEAGHLWWRRQHGYRWRRPADWLAVMQALTDLCLRSEDDYEQLFDCYFGELAACGAVYAEPGLALDRCVRNGLAPDAVLRAAVRAMDRAELQHGVRSRLLIALDYRMSVDECYAHIEWGLHLAPSRVAGIDLQGMPRGGRQRLAEVFQHARRRGLGCRAHVGEFEGARSVWEAIEVLGVDRIAHGVRALEDAALMARLERDGLALDMAIGSNVALGVAPSWQQHPVSRFLERGIAVSLSADDPLFFSPNVAEEYRCAAAALGWNAAQVAAMQHSALSHSFAPAAVKACLAGILDHSCLQGAA